MKKFIKLVPIYLIITLMPVALFAIATVSPGIIWVNLILALIIHGWLMSTLLDLVTGNHFEVEDYEPLQIWEEDVSDIRMTAIGQNGNDGDHYDEVK